MQALGAYFEELRGSRSRAALAADIGVSEMSILRIEEKGQEPKAEMLNALVRALHARWEDVEALLSNPRATAGEGRELAQQRIEERAKEIAYRVSEGDASEVRKLIQRLRANPDELRELRQLLSGQDGTQRR